MTFVVTEFRGKVRKQMNKLVGTRTAWVRCSCESARRGSRPGSTPAALAAVTLSVLPHMPPMS